MYSTPGNGTTFNVYLPACPDASGEIPVEIENSQTPGGSETIMLVEDDKLVLGFTKDVLSRQGYTVISAGNGSEALNILSAHTGNVDLLLTDVIMPSMNGKELYTEAQKKLPHLKVLYISG